MPRPWLPLVLLLAACGAVAQPGKDGALDSGMPTSPADSSPRDTAPGDTADTGSPSPDSDGDGTPDDEDCAPADPAIHPGAEDACDEVDNDCDGEVDEDAPLWHADADGDGYGDASGGTRACEQPPGLLADGSDCDDGDATVSPAAEETCGDGIDNDCDGGGCRHEGILGLDEVGTWVRDGMAPEGHGRWVPSRIELAGGCDVDGDAVPDLAVGVSARWEYGWDESLTSGELYILTGGTAPPETWQQAPYRVTPPEEGTTGLASYVACAGDIDGDGVDELLVSEFPEGWEVAPMVTRVVSGFTAGEATSLPSPLATIAQSAGVYPALLATGGDLDGDGTAEIVVQDVDGTADSPRYAFIFPGTTRGEVESASAPSSVAAGPGESFYTALVAADTDGDGLSDLVLGVSSDTGDDDRVCVFPGPLAAGGLVTADATTQLDDAGDPGERYSAYWQLATPGDADGDGLDDLAIANGRGNVYVVLAPLPATGSLPAVASATFEEDESSGSLAWFAMEAAGDLDGDGRGEIAFTAGFAPDEARGYPNGATGAVLAYAPFSGTSAIPGAGAAALFGHEDYAYCWAGVAGIGDFDGDAVDDFAVACTGYTDNSGTEPIFVTAGVWLVPGLGL